MHLHTSTLTFLSLAKAGLWEEKVLLSTFGEVDWQTVYRLAEEQSVVGLVAAGIEQVKDVVVPPAIALKFASSALRLEQRNTAMNEFVAKLVGKLRSAGIYALLVKGQGIAQCYNRPLWRACGDIDLFLDEPNYQKAKKFLTPLASSVEEENIKDLHYLIYIDNWPIELHGTLRSLLWDRLDKGLDATQATVFGDGKVRTWMNGEMPVMLPAIDEDIVFVFSHILQHFFRGGIGLRQICDWCRLLWTYRADINQELMAMRLKEMDAMTEWKAFAALAVNTLGMPADAMPFYSQDRRWARKADKILAFVLETGNFGHNRDNSYYKTSPYLVRKAISLWRHTKDGLRQFTIFPKHSLIAWGQMLKEGVKAVGRGK